ncbi:GntR family transcriptional regulator [Salinisphaera aquimarina]|uniref:GntR family transcriptional regulator n=1 Tax=Salinisphaera aquimarina TaxID=2094031 RepID=A0ABV7EJV8_9GAMM
MSAAIHVPTAPAHGGKSRGNLGDRIYRQLKQEIFDFRLIPGDRLSENEIAARVNASRTPVREALFRLQRDGYVEVLSRSGWQVRPFDFDYFEELYDVRTVLECACVQRICELAGVPPELEALKPAWLVPVAERLSESETVWGLDERFHAALVRAAGNTVMVAMHDDVTERIRIIRRLDFTQSRRVQATYDEHAEILRALLQKRAAQAQMLLRSHIRSSRNEVRKITLHMLYEARQSAQA